MSSIKLSSMAKMIRYWSKTGILYCGYNSKGILCFFIKACKKNKTTRNNEIIYKEVPHSWEFICNHEGGIISAWDEIKKFRCDNNSLPFDTTSDKIVHSGFFGG